MTKVSQPGYMRAYYLRNHEQILSAARRWYLDNCERAKARARQYHAANREACLESHRRWSTSPRAKQIIRQGRKRTRLSSPTYRLKMSLRRRVLKALDGREKSASTMSLLGCSVEFLKFWLELQFRPNMTWDNRHEWHIDHKRPCASFDLTDPSQQRECFHYSNLQPLWVEENQRKGARV